MVCRSDAPFLTNFLKQWRAQGRKMGLGLLFGVMPFFASGWELSVGPPLGFSLLNSVSIFGNQAPSVPIKVRINHLEYGLLLSTTPFFTVEGSETIVSGGKWGGEVYFIYGGAIPMALNVGGGIYALKLWDFGVRLEHTTLFAFGGKYLNYRADGPLLVRAYNLMLSYTF